MLGVPLGERIIGISPGFISLGSIRFGQAPLILDSDETLDSLFFRRQSSRFCARLCPVRQTAVPDLAGFSKIFEHQHDLLDGSAGLIAVQPVNIDAINPEALQT